VPFINFVTRHWPSVMAFITRSSLAASIAFLHDAKDSERISSVKKLFIL
jgi:hypothetical protein